MSHELLAPSHPAPVMLVVFLGALVTPTVFLGFTLLHSVWLTYISLYYLWVVAPAAVCYFWSGSRQRVLVGWRRGIRRLRVQAALALPTLPLVIGGGMLAYHLLARPLGIDPDAMRAALRVYGLTADNPVGDLGALTWLTFLNPIMEECFWRIFLFESLRHSEAASAWLRWWAPCLATSLLYASYHVPGA